MIKHVHIAIHVKQGLIIQVHIKTELTDQEINGMNLLMIKHVHIAIHVKQQIIRHMILLNIVQLIGLKPLLQQVIVAHIVIAVIPKPEMVLVVPVHQPIMKNGMVTVVILNQR